MALAVSRLAKVAGGGSASYNFGSVTVTAGALLAVGITSRSRAAQTVSSVQTTADTSGWSSTAVVADGNGNFTQWWYKWNVTGGTSQSCTVTFSASISDVQITLSQATGADTTASAYITENSGLATSLSTVTSGSMTLPSRECVIFAAAVTTNDRSWTPDNGATELYDSFVEDASGSGQTHYRIISGGGNFTAGSTASSSFGFAAIGTLVIGSPAGPPITQQPTSVRTSAGQTATFNAAATGATSQKWQSNATGSWVDISGATSTSYTTPPLAAGTAYAVRIIFTASGLDTISDPADVWTPAVTSRPWRAVRIGSDLLRSRLLLGSSVAALRVGEDVLFGAAPSSGTTTLAPTTGHLVLAGKAPALARTLAPGKGALTLTGYAPGLARTTVLAPGTGHLTFAGYAPGLSVAALTNIEPGTGHLVLAGKAPSLTRTLAPSTGHLTFAGYAPTLLGANVIGPGAGHLTFTGYAPTIVRTTVLTPATGHLAFTGYQPSLGGTVTIEPGTGHLALAGRAPALARTTALEPGAGRLAFTGYGPALLRTTVLAPGAGHLVFTGRAPSITVSFPGGAVFPTPDQVAAGVQYGPSGADYTGTKTTGGYMRRR